MFENLTERLSGTFRKLSGKATLTENNIQDALREVRRALLEADVALPVVKDFIDRVSNRAVGQEVSKSLTPGQAFIKVVQAEMQAIMGSANSELNLKSAPPAVVLMAGLQGAGKTTAAGKLALYLKEREVDYSIEPDEDVDKETLTTARELKVKESEGGRALQGRISPSAAPIEVCGTTPCGWSGVETR